MKRLDTTPITASNQFPVKSGTLDFIQDAHKETASQIVTSLLGYNPVADTIYILSGCVNSATLPAHNISAGTLFINGEIYAFDGASFTLSGLNKAYARIETTQYTTNADPVQFTDGISRNVHNIRKIVVEATTTSSGLPEFKDFVLGGAWLRYDVKEVDFNLTLSPTYLADNFDSSGLGKNERKGWAICNGSNGTKDRGGKVAIGYHVTNYPTIGATGGSANSVLMAHSHEAGSYDTIGDPSTTLYTGQGLTSGGSNVYKYTKKKGISNTGTDAPTEDGIGKNMQPYIVTLFIQKV